MYKMKKLLNVNVFAAVAVYGIMFAVLSAVENRVYHRGFLHSPVFLMLVILFPVFFLIGVYQNRNSEKKERSKVFVRVQYAFVCIIFIVGFINIYFLFFQNGEFKTDVTPWQIIAFVIGGIAYEILRKKRSWNIGVKYAANALTTVYSAMLVATVLFLWIA